ncbi:UDP-N-acetylmuramoyl-L-alanine--D-glutamate ligase [Malaciobacter molluscorum LMG 25693]|uniref:UDP-N-acetylmuramoyl-L-alanine--D-glutamate ligase n=1 Tax=Malaciobacter molluscorum LMG 25693 TaxID=870501 RepID=A0A2G1DEW9_9BACT|nr:UDP-N-acetylmuramoyl-L-alanine--D-glutamate ligase [Malaciobacter molluscorum]AXX93267.1 UDP-N-acetylmuramoyl-L-alanine:D-glutamate ligase [Malaciobacter molluscorum LMG 25693]PHO17052.1 UDP-N-acetylmuramoyl-L-alanine--D-glutamate ligase [Malaciobacter molluscorum LMG 25693]
MIRVLGKGLTAKALKDSLVDVELYDDENFNEYNLSSDEVTIVSPGIPPFNNMVKNANNLMSDYDYFSSSMPFSIWISGTNGKTTTTQMTQHLLEDYGSVCGGNIGTPISKLDKNSKIWILETSSFTLHYTNKARPNLYILLPISEDHITWHNSFKEYELSKLKPLNFMKEGEIAIVPKKYENYKTNAKLITYNNSDDLCKEFNIDKNEIKFKEPFLLDAILAMAAKKIIFDEIDYEKINSFKVDAHKIEEVLDKNNRLWINDSKATNIDATINALVPYKSKKIHLILGGDDKGANLTPLFEFLNDYNVDIYAIGTNSDKLESLCDKYDIKCYNLKYLKNAVEKINVNLDKSAIAILSPAAASLDQFSSYAQRGNEFKELISALSLN